MQNPYKVFHSSSESLKQKINIVLVRPEQGGNVGSIARALANMGIEGDWKIVGTGPEILTEECRKFAKHAIDRLQKIQFFPTLNDALVKDPRHLVLAATARIGSPQRPHPLRIRTAMERAIPRMQSGELDQITFVFGPESDGLMNAEIELCDWVVTIPSGPGYRSLNLAQAVLIFAYEAHHALLQDWEAYRSGKPSQKERLVTHFLQMAEDVGFILPGDPYKMRPRLEEVLGQLPHHIQDTETLHGLLNQIRRSVKAGAPEIRGRYKAKLRDLEAKKESQYGIEQ